MFNVIFYVYAVNNKHKINAIIHFRNKIVNFSKNTAAGNSATLLSWQF